MIINGDCLEELKKLPDKSVDFFYADLPYGETACKWDTCIDLTELWKQYKRLAKHDRVAYVFSCSTKFGYKLIQSNERMFKMDLVWKKRNKTGGIYSRYRPMKNHEMVYFFYKKAPKYNRDKYHKRIKRQQDCNKKGVKVDPNKSYHKEGGVHGNTTAWKGCLQKMKDVDMKKAFGPNFDPPNPLTLINDNLKDKTEYYENGKEFYGKCTAKKQFGAVFSPPNPASVIETCYSNKEYYKDRKVKDNFGNAFIPPNPASVIETDKDIYGKTKEQNKKRMEKRTKNYSRVFTPPNPASVIETDEKNSIYGTEDPKKWTDRKKFKSNFDPTNPVSVINDNLTEEKPTKEILENVLYGSLKYNQEKPNTIGTRSFDPPNPVSVIEQKEDKKSQKMIYLPEKKCWVNQFGHFFIKSDQTTTGWKEIGKNFCSRVFDPPNPASVIEQKEEIIGEKPENKWNFGYTQTGFQGGGGPHFDPALPVTIFTSKKVFIGKRNHQTEKPLDLMEFLLKYWTDEGDNVLDPTMGSGSMGVQCAIMDRNFIGIEKDPDIFKTAQNRIKNKK